MQAFSFWGISWEFECLVGKNIQPKTCFHSRCDDSSTSSHFIITCIEALCMLFQVLALGFPSSISRIACMLGSRNVRSLKFLNSGGHPFLHARWQNTLTGMFKMCVLRNTCALLVTSTEFCLIPLPRVQRRKQFNNPASM